MSFSPSTERVVLYNLSVLALARNPLVTAAILEARHDASPAALPALIERVKVYHEAAIAAKSHGRLVSFYENPVNWLDLFDLMAEPYSSLHAYAPVPESIKAEYRSKIKESSIEASQHEGFSSSSPAQTLASSSPRPSTPDTSVVGESRCVYYTTTSPIGFVPARKDTEDEFAEDPDELMVPDSEDEEYMEDIQGFVPSHSEDGTDAEDSSSFFHIDERKQTDSESSEADESTSSSFFSDTESVILTQEDAAQEAAADEERVVHEETAQMDRNVPMLDKGPVSTSTHLDAHLDESVSWMDTDAARSNPYTANSGLAKRRRAPQVDLEHKAIQSNEKRTVASLPRRALSAAIAMARPARLAEPEAKIVSDDDARPSKKRRCQLFQSGNYTKHGLRLAAIAFGAGVAFGAYQHAVPYVFGVGSVSVDPAAQMPGMGGYLAKGSSASQLSAPSSLSMIKAVEAAAEASFQIALDGAIHELNIRRQLLPVIVEADDRLQPTGLMEAAVALPPLLVDLFRKAYNEVPAFAMAVRGTAAVAVFRAALHAGL